MPKEPGGRRLGPRGRSLKPVGGAEHLWKRPLGEVCPRSRPVVGAAPSRRLAGRRHMTTEAGSSRRRAAQGSSKTSGDGAAAASMAEAVRPQRRTKAKGGRTKGKVRKGLASRSPWRVCSVSPNPRRLLSRAWNPGLTPGLSSLPAPQQVGERALLARLLARPALHIKVR